MKALKHGVGFIVGLFGTAFIYTGAMSNNYGAFFLGVLLAVIGLALLD